MVKLASAREARTYGPRRSRERAEYVNSGLYLFAALVLMAGFAAQLFSAEPISGLVLLMIAMLIFLAVNLHDLVAHLAGFDYRLGLMEYDIQLGVVEFAAPLVQALGSLLFFLAFLFLLIQEEKGYKHVKLERQAEGMLIAGPILWLIGSIQNSCQIYERADAHLQILQQAVHIPFLIATVLFAVGAIINARHQAASDHHGLRLLGITWIWLGIVGTLFLLIGGFMNLVKVFKMQQGDGSFRLEKLRGGAQERLIHEREGRAPLILEDQQRRRRRKQAEEEAAKRAQADAVAASSMTTPYKDVLIGQAQA